MPRVMIVCPVTERPVPTRFEADESRAFHKGVPESGTVICEACGRRHSWFRPETLLEGDPMPRAQRHRDAAIPARSGWVMRHVEIGRR